MYQMYSVSACDIRKRFVFETSIRGRLIKSATSSAKIVGTVGSSVGAQ